MNLLKMLQSEPLHLYYLIITGSVIEGVTSLREIVQHISRIKNRHPATVHPGYPKQVVCKFNENRNWNVLVGRGLVFFIHHRLVFWWSPVTIRPIATIGYERALRPCVWPVFIIYILFTLLFAISFIYFCVMMGVLCMLRWIVLKLNQSLKMINIYLWLYDFLFHFCITPHKQRPFQTLAPSRYEVTVISPRSSCNNNNSMISIGVYSL